MHNELYASFWSHIEALRSTFIKILAILVVGIIGSFFFYESVINFLTSPLNTPTKNSHLLHEEQLEQIHVFNPLSETKLYILPMEAVPSTIQISGGKEITPNTYEIHPQGALTFSKKTSSNPLVILGPLEGIIIALKVSLWLGCFVTSPFWLLILLQFVAPALRKEEKRLIWPFLILSVSFILLGCWFAYSVTIPFANTYLMSFNKIIGSNLWSLRHYLDYTLFLLFANGLAFEFFVFGIFAVELGIVGADKLVKSRRIAIIVAFILGALLTPPDIFTQFMLAIPLIVLYEGVITYAHLRKRSS